MFLNLVKYENDGETFIGILSYLYIYKEKENLFKKGLNFITKFYKKIHFNMNPFSRKTCSLLFCAPEKQARINGI